MFLENVATPSSVWIITKHEKVIALAIQHPAHANSIISNRAIKIIINARSAPKAGMHQLYSKARSTSKISYSLKKGYQFSRLHES